MDTFGEGNLLSAQERLWAKGEGKRNSLSPFPLTSSPSKLSSRLGNSWRSFFLFFPKTFGKYSSLKSTKKSRSAQEKALVQDGHLQSGSWAIIQSWPGSWLSKELTRLAPKRQGDKNFPLSPCPLLVKTCEKRILLANHPALSKFQFGQIN